MNRTTRTILVYGLVVLMLVLMGQRFLDEAAAPEEVGLTLFEEAVRDGAITEVTILERSNAVEGTIPAGAEVPDGFPTNFRVPYTAEYEEETSLQVFRNNVTHSDGSAYSPCRRSYYRPRLE